MAIRKPQTGTLRPLHLDHFRVKVETTENDDRMISRFRRLIKILALCCHYGVDREVLSVLAPSYLLRFIPYYRRLHQKPLGKRLFLLFIDLGPLFIKLGQLISIRHDLFDESITVPLGKLQDDVPPFDGQTAVQIIERSFHQPITNVFLLFDTKPLASASISQVHRAKLKDHTSVAVKVIRPGIKETLKIDIQLLRWFFTALSGLRSWNRQVMLSLLDEYEYTLKQELNLIHEASHYTQMRENFKNDDRLYIPKIYWDYTRKNVLTIEYIHAVAIDKVDQHPNIDRKTLAYNGVSIFFTQVFKHRFFHADMHPGNLFVEDGTTPKYIAIDFGIVGTLSPRDQYYLAENFLAFHQRDYTRIATLHIESGWVDPNTDLIKFEAAIRHVCEPIFSRPIEEISIAELMHRLIEVGKPFKLNIQPQLLILQKTLFHVEALGRKLYPKLNLWEAAAPFLETFMQERTSTKHAWHTFKQELPRIIEIMPKIPYLLHERLQPPPKTTNNHLILGIAVGALLTNPAVLTSPVALYIMSASFIIMILCRFLK